MLGDVVWKDLDVLLIDLPPGADSVKDVMTLHAGLSGVIAVTIPSEESYRSVARALRAAEDAGAPILGIVENMSGYACPRCDEVGPLFAGDAGGRLAETARVPLLGRVPFRPADAGPPRLPDEVVRRLAEVIA
jgi:ATP-binding protein involved in chromosome partitioning